MRKPNIEIEILSEYTQGHYNGVHLNGEVLCICYTDKKSDAVRSMIEALLDAREFIENGIEFGYIRMPDKEINDPASKTPDVINKALEKAGCNEH